MKPRHPLILGALLAGALGCVGAGPLVTAAMAGNAPTEILEKPPCVMQPTCRPAAEEQPASVTAMTTLDTLALHAALQNSSVFGLLRALHEPDSTVRPQEKWCKN